MQNSNLFRNTNIVDALGLSIYQTHLCNGNVTQFTIFFRDIRGSYTMLFSSSPPVGYNRPQNMYTIQRDTELANNFIRTLANNGNIMKHPLFNRPHFRQIVINYGLDNQIEVSHVINKIDNAGVFLPILLKHSPLNIGVFSNTAALLKTFQPYLLHLYLALLPLFIFSIYFAYSHVFLSYYYTLLTYMEVLPNQTKDIIMVVSYILGSALYFLYRHFRLVSKANRKNPLHDKLFDYLISHHESIILCTIILVISTMSIYLCGDFNYTECDAPRAWGLYFQDSASPQMEALVELHDNIMYYLVAILFSVGWIQGAIIKNFESSNSPISNKYLNHGTLIELIWTITPALILVLIAFPSFKLLYLMDEVTDPSLSVVAEGHQWYWSYEYPDFLTSEGDFVEFDSYLVPESDLEKGGLRMLEVDNRVILPEITHTRFILTAADVIHSFAIPALGVKCDAYPGRLNQFSVLINRLGTFYGQCSEICGILHSSMPIVVESVSLVKFLSWLQEQ